MISFLRTIFTIITAFVVTTVLGRDDHRGLMRVEDKPDGIYDTIRAGWSRSVMWAAE